MNAEEALRMARKILGVVAEMMSWRGADRRGEAASAELENALAGILMGAHEGSGSAEAGASDESTADGAGPQHVITFTLGVEDFQLAMGRRPRNEAEFREWAELCEKGLCNGHIDWDIVYQCAREALEAQEEG